MVSPNNDPTAPGYVRGFRASDPWRIFRIYLPNWPTCEMRWRETMAISKSFENTKKGVCHSLAFVFFFGCDLVIGMRSLWIHIIYCSILCIWYVFVNVFGYMISEIKDPFVIPYFRRPSTHAFPCPKQGFQQKFCSGCGIPSKLFSLMMTSLASTSKGYIEY